jgi:hypothetical protein
MFVDRAGLRPDVIRMIAGHFAPELKVTSAEELAMGLVANTSTVLLRVRLRDLSVDAAA